VASDTRALSDIIGDGEDGLLVAPDDAPALAGALRCLRDDPELLGRLRTGARARAAELRAADPAGAWLAAVARQDGGAGATTPEQTADD
jgi:glycosyltransferase involved in cell wall biosynthesis